MPGLYCSLSCSWRLTVLWPVFPCRSSSARAVAVPCAWATHCATAGGFRFLDPQKAAPSRQMLLLQFKPNLGINCFDQQDLASQPHRPSCRIGMHRRRPRQSATTLRQEKCGSLILRIAHFLLLAPNAVSIELRGDYFHSYIPLRELP